MNFCQYIYAYLECESICSLPPPTDRPTQPPFSLYWRAKVLESSIHILISNSNLIYAERNIWKDYNFIIVYAKYRIFMIKQDTQQSNGNKFDQETYYASKTRLGQ